MGIAMTKHHHKGLIQSFSVSYWEAHKAQLDAGPAFDILDSAANIGAALNSLNTDSHISQIVISDGAPVVVSVSQLTGDAVALSKLINEDNSAAALTVSDTAAHIGASFATIATEGQVTSIVVSDNAVVTLTAAQSAYTAAVGELINANSFAANVHVKDTAVNLATYLNAIQADGSTVTEVVVSNSTAMTLSAQQVSQDATALSKVAYNNGGTVHFLVNDNGTNIGTYLNALNAQTKISTITDSNNAAISVSVAEITSDATALSKIVNANGSAYALTVSDTAADVAGGAAAINGNSHVTTVSISDSAANVQANLDGLEGVSHSIPMTIVLTDGSTPTITVTDTQYTNDSSVLADITGSYNLDVTGVTAAGAAAVYANAHVASFVVTDSAANVQNAIDSLASYASKISSISLTDGGTPTLTISETQYHNDTAILDAITNTYDLTLTGVLAADAASLAGATVDNGTVTQLYVNDTAAHIATSLANLDNADVIKAVVSDGNSIQINIASLEANGAALAKLYASDGTDAATVTISDTAANIAGDLAGLNSDTQVTKIIISDNGLTEVTIAQITSYAHALSELYNSDGTTRASLSVADTAANISPAFDSLQEASNVTKIIITDNGTVTIGAQSAANDGSALGELYESNGTTHAQVVVSDSAANIATYLGELEGNVSHISSISMNDGSRPTLTLSEAQLGTDSAAYNLISWTGGQFNVAVTGVVAADVGTVATEVGGNAHATLTSIIVDDTASNISTAFDNLETFAGAHSGVLTKLIVTDSGSHEVTLSANSLLNDGTVEALLYNSDGSTPANIAVADTATNIANNLVAIQDDSQVNNIYVADTAQNIAAQFDELNGLTYLTGIMINNGGTLSIAYSTLTVDTKAFGLIGNASFNVAITGVSVANASSVASAVTSENAHADLTSISVTDTASAISGGFGALNGLGLLSQIIVSDSGSNEVTLTAAAAVADTTAEGLLYQNGGVTRASVQVSDNAANVVANTSALNGNAHVNHVDVVDNAANVGTHFDALNSVSHLSISLTSGALSITEHQLTNDTVAFAAITTLNFSLDVTNVLAADAGSIASEVTSANSNANLVSIAVSDTVDNVVANSAALNANGLVASVLATGTAPDIATNFGALNGVDHLTHIIVSDSGSNEVTLSVASALADTAAESVLVQSDGLTAAHVAVSDSAANVSGNASSLNSNSHVDHVYVVDSASNVETYIASGNLDSVAHLAITLTGGGTPAMLFTEAQFVAGETAIGEVTNNSFTVNVSGIAVAQLSTVTSGYSGLANSAHINLVLGISDSAQNIAGAVSTLNANSHINSVQVVDGAADVANYLNTLNGVDHLTVDINDGGTLAVTEGQLHGAQADLAALGAISDSFNIAITNVLAADVGSIAGEVSSANALATLTAISVSDTAANISSQFGALNSNGLVNKIIVSDSASNEVQTSVSELADTAALGNLYQADGTDRALVTVSDTAAAISGSFSSVTGSPYVNKVDVSDNAALTITAQQAVSSSGLFGEFYNANGTTHATIDVADIASNISVDFNSLNGIAGSLGKIVVSDSASHEVKISVASYEGDANALAELYKADGVTHASVAVLDSAANISAALGTLNTATQVNHIIISDNSALSLAAASAVNDTHALNELANANQTAVSLTISDTAANISHYIDQLNSIATVSSVFVSDGNSLDITAAQVSNDTSVLGKLDAGSTIEVTDTAANISLHLGALAANNDIVAIIDQNNAALTVTVSDLGNYASLLSEIVNNDDVTPATIDVKDAAANIEAALGDLNANTTPAAIIISDNTALTMSIADYTTDTSLLSRLEYANANPYQLNISDNGAAISTVLDTLNGDSHIAVITDTNEAAITLSVAQITSDAHALSLLVNGDNSAYALSVTDSSSNIGAALDALNGNSHVTGIYFTDQSPVFNLTAVQVGTDSRALGLIDTDDTGNYALSIYVTDTAAHITTYLDALGANTDVVSITISDNAPITVNANQLLVTDTQAIGLLANQNGGTVDLILDDTASHISNNITDLAAYTSGSPEITSVVISDNAAVSVTVGDLSLDSALIGDFSNANHTAYMLIVTGNASQISGALGTLETYVSGGHVQSITVTDSNPIAVNVADITTYANVLAALVNGDSSAYTLAVSDTASNVAGDLGALNSNSHVETIFLSDGGTPLLTITESQLTGDTTALGKISNGTFDVAVTNVLAADATSIAGEVTGANGHAVLTSISVTDTAANIASAFNALNGAGELTKIIVSNSGSAEVTLSAAAALADTTAESLLYQANGSTPAHVAVSDTAANVGNNATGLNANAAIDHVYVSDSAGNVGSNLNGLNAVNHLAITITGGGTLTITESQLTGDTTALGEITNGSFNVAVTNVLAADASSIAGEVTSANSHATLTSISVTDTAGNIQAAFATLNGVAHLAQIIVSNSGSVEVTLSASAALADTTAEGLLYQSNGTTPADVAVSDTAANVAGNASGLNGNTHVDHVYVSDNAGNVASNLNALNGVHHLAITITGGGTLTITESQLTGDTTALGEITNGSFNVAVTNVLAADASSIAGEVASANGHATLTSISVSDSAAHVAASLGSLNGLSDLVAITLTGGGTQTLSITEAQLTSDTSALDLITNNPYNLAVTNVAAADAASIAGDAAAITSHEVLSSIAVLDSAANVQAALDSLETVANGSVPLTIALTNGGTPTLTVSETTYHGDAAALGDITSNYQLAVTSVLAADATSIAGDSHVVSIAIDDSAANVQGALDTLESVHAKITNIVLTDGSTPTLAITGTQFINDASVIGDISSAYHLSVNHVLAANAATVALNSHVTAISVYDTGANISASLDALNGNADLTSIVISDNAPLALAAHSAVQDSFALGLLSNANNQAVSLTVRDTAANISEYFDSLNSIGTISAITISDNKALTLTASQVFDDLTALAMTTNANGQPILINVHDTAANISTYLDQLEANPDIGAITVSDNLSVVASIAQLTSDADALAALVNANGSGGTVKVVDTGANITANLANLNADTQVTSIVISDNAQLTLNVTEVVNDARALSELSNANNAAVSEKVQDTALNIQNNLASLQADAHITSVIVSNNTALTLTAAEVANDAGVLAEVSNRNGGAVTFNIVDTAANITTNFAALAANSKIASITISDNSAITLSVAELSGDASTVAKLVNQNASPYSLIISDTGANLSGAEFDTLNGNSHVTSIIIADNGAVGLSVSQMETDTTALSELHNANGTQYSMTITDTAANISAAISQLGQQGHVGAINVSDNGVVTSTYALYQQYGAIFHDIQGTHYLDITNVTGQSYTSFTETINGSEQVVQVDYYNGANLLEQLNYTYNNDGSYVAYGSDIVGKPYTTFTFNYNASHQLVNAEYFAANGSEYENVAYTYNQNGTTGEVITGLSGITQETVLLDTHGSMENEFVYYANNTQTVYFFENGQSFASDGEFTSLKITAGTTGHTFSFTGAFNEVFISNYAPGSETINWDHNDFANIAAVEAHAYQDGGGDAVVKLDANDYIVFTGVSLATFEAHTSDWHFI
jgi:hypothetical protein